MHCSFCSEIFSSFKYFSNTPKNHCCIWYLGLCWAAFLWCIDTGDNRQTFDATCDQLIGRWAADHCLHMYLTSATNHINYISAWFANFLAQNAQKCSQAGLEKGKECNKEKVKKGMEREARKGRNRGPHGFPAAINSIPTVFPQVLVPSLQYSCNNCTHSCGFATDGLTSPSCLHPPTHECNVT